MTMITPSYLGETIEYSSLHACRSTLEDPKPGRLAKSCKTRLGRQRLPDPFSLRAYWACPKEIKRRLELTEEVRVTR